MAEAFDPYYIWLAIPPEDQPPNYYRLLGVKTFEANVDVLESAADQRMSHLRSFQTGKHSAESQKLLNELAAARLCLLSPERRQAYDRELKAKLAAEKPPAAPSKPAVTKPLAVVRPMAAKPVAPAAALGFDPLADSSGRRTPKKRPSKQSPAIYAGIGIRLIAVVAVAWVAMGGGGGSKVDRGATGNPDGGVTADKLVLWNCNNHGRGTQGMLSCNFELRRADKVVWSQKAVVVEWAKDEGLATSIRLPKVPFDTLRLETTAYQGLGAALCEVEIFRGDKNIARDKPVTTSAAHTSGFAAAGFVDGIKDSSQDHVGYWVGADHQLAWIEVQVAPPVESSKHSAEKK